MFSHYKDINEACNIQYTFYIATQLVLSIVTNLKY